MYTSDKRKVSLIHRGKHSSHRWPFIVGIHGSPTAGVCSLDQDIEQAVDVTEGIHY